MKVGNLLEHNIQIMCEFCENFTRIVENLYFAARGKGGGLGGGFGGGKGGKKGGGGGIVILALMMGKHS